jgi:lysozyme
MILSKNGIELLKRLEGIRAHLYNDSAGLPTIGVGHLLIRDELSSGKINILGESVKYSAGLTETQIEKLLSHDVAFAEGAINVCDISLAQNQFDALVCFVFNVGRNAFDKSTLKKCLVAGDTNKIPEQFRRWIYAGGKISKGLIGRREQEIKLFLTN